MVVLPDAAAEPTQQPQPVTPVPSRQGIYTSIGLAVGFGARTPIDNAPTSPSSNESFQASTVLAPNLAVGYSFAGAWRAEAEYVGFYSQASNDVTENGQFRQLSGNQVATNAIQFNLLKDISLGSRLTPYIGGGIGFATSQYSVIEGSATGTTFAGQGKVGLSYAVSPTTSMVLGYRILGIAGGTTLSFWPDRPTTGARVQQSLDVGVRFGF